VKIRPAAGVNRSERRRAEFEQFVIESSPALLRTAYLVAWDLTEAEDLVQECLLAVARRWPRVRGMEHPHAYARRMLINLAGQHQRDQRHGDDRAGDEHRAAAGRSSPGLPAGAGRRCDQLRGRDPRHERRPGRRDGHDVAVELRGAGAAAGMMSQSSSGGAGAAAGMMSQSSSGSSGS